MNRYKDAEPLISEKAVCARTGKGWIEWFVLLDEAGAKESTHKHIVAWLTVNTQLSPWWQQMVAVSYEQSRGLRDRHEKSDGFQVSATKTIAAAPMQVYSMWTDSRKRRSWLTEEISIAKERKGRSLRVEWHDGSKVDVTVYEVEPMKCRISVEHARLVDSATAIRMKEFWKQHLVELAVKLTKEP